MSDQTAPTTESAWLRELYDQFADVRDEARGLSDAEINAAIDDAVRAVRSRLDQ